MHYLTPILLAAVLLLGQSCTSTVRGERPPSACEDARTQADDPTATRGEPRGVLPCLGSLLAASLSNILR